jgi:cytochrome c
MRRSTKVAMASCASAVVAAIAVAVIADRVQARHELEARVTALTGGDPKRGERAIAVYGCGTCHEVPGVRTARGTVGPPLTRYGARTYVAGALRNTPENLVHFIRDPQAVEPGTAMPDVGVSEQDGRDIAAYLYTLE